MDKTVKSINNFPLLDENCPNDEFLKKKLAYPYEFFNLQEPLNLTKEDFWSTLKQETPPQAPIDCTQAII